MNYIVLVLERRTLALMAMNPWNLSHFLSHTNTFALELATLAKYIDNFLDWLP